MRPEELTINPTFSFDSDMEINYVSFAIDPTYSEEVIDVEVDNTNTISVMPHEDNHNPHTQRQLIGATLVGAVAGCFACGPVMGVPVGAGAAALAVSSDTKTGEWARRGGDALADAGVKAAERIQKIEQDTHLMDKTRSATSQSLNWTCQRLQEIDEEHHLVDKTKKGVAGGYEWATRRLEPNDSPRAVNSPQQAFE